MKSDNENTFEHELNRYDPPSPDPAFVETLAQKMHAAHVQHVARQHRRRLRLWPWTAGGLGAAAAMVALMLWFSSDVGFAAVQKSLRNVNAAQFQARLVADHVSGWPDHFLTMHVWLDAWSGARSRAEILGQPILESITRWDEDVWVVNHLRGEVTSWSHGQNVDRWIRELDPAMLVQQLRDTRGIAAQELGSEAIDGRDARCFRLTGRPLALHPDAQLTLWVDVETNLPLRIVYALPQTPQGRLRLIVDRFSWNEPMPAEWFMPPTDLPHVASLNELLPPVNREAVVNTLRRFADRTDGYYPGHPRAIPAMAMMYFQWQREGDTSINAHVEMLEEMLAAGVFLLDLARRGTAPTYHGHKVTADDTDAILLSWQPAPDQTQILYGDLRFETVDTATRP